MNEQIEIIDKALANLQQKYYDNSWHLFLWGSLALCACSLHYCAMLLQKYNYIGIIWLVVMLIGSIVEIYMGIKHQTKVQSSSVLEKAIGIIWLLLGISNAFTAFLAPAMGLINYSAIIPLIMMQVWIGVLFTGLLIKFKPLIILSNIWAVSALIMIIRPESNQILLMGISIIFAYLVPGFLLRNQCKNVNG